jgi:erythromycin esterase-like protein
MSQDVLETLRRAAYRIEIDADGFEPLVERLAGADVVLIGEASHGTHEFYDARAALTKTLIERHGFNIVAVEADWPDAYRANRWVRHASTDGTAEEALADFRRFPRWLWRNTVVTDFLTWLWHSNARRDDAARVGFYGLDLYSLHTSMDAVLAYLRRVDPAAAERARYRYGCFEDFGEEPQAYGYAAAFGLSRTCEDEVVGQLVEMTRRAGDYASRDGRPAADEYFSAEQNARLVRNAEQYYRAMFRGHIESWNLRDTHMMETLETVMDHVARTQTRARAVVWAHNSHLGDARATQMGRIGELNLGQLVRERFGDASRLIGLTTHTGTVTAASNWDEPAARKRVRPSLPGSYERLFHDTGLERFLLLFDDAGVRDALAAPRLERAIGVLYRPDTERTSHYFEARMASQFDAVMHVDDTRALELLERWSLHDADLPETYPSAL